MNALADEYGRKNGLSRRRFFQTAAGMTTAFVAMNEVYGPIYGASPAEAQKRRSRAGARRWAEGPVHHGRAHALPARRHAARRLRARPRGGRQGGLESRARGQAADPGRPQVSQLVQGGLPRQRHQGGADQRLGLGGSARLVPDQRDEGRCARQGERGGRHQAPAVARHLHAGLRRLDGRGRQVHRNAQARFVEGLHGRRQHQQGPGAPSLAHGRREAGLSLLREDREGGLRHRLRAQGPLSAVGREALPASHALRHGRRRRQGGQGLAEHPLRDLPLGLPLDRRARRLDRRAMPSSRRPAASNGRPTSPRFPASTASATSTPTSARSSPRPR